jgi:hypothetical protein
VKGRNGKESQNPRWHIPQQIELLLKPRSSRLRFAGRRRKKTCSHWQE